MAQSHKAKHPPLDVLQSMVNGILIEIGRALRTSDKENGRTFASASARLQSTIPSAANNFHQALDDLEIELLRARAVLQRDLDSQRAQRLAREAPIPEPEPQSLPEETATTPILEAERSPEKSPVTAGDALVELSGAPGDSATDAQPLPDNIDSPQIQATEDTKQLEAVAPTSNPQENKPVGLGINTEAIPSPTAQEISGVPNSSVDSLFDVPDNENADAMLNFDEMDFSGDASNTQTQDQSQSNNLDLSAFGEHTEDFSMLDIPGVEASGVEANNTTTDDTNKIDDIFGDLGGNTGDGTMDLDLGNMDMGDQNSFDDLFMAGDADDVNLGNSTEMEHGLFDDAYFGLDA